MHIARNIRASVWSFTPASGESADDIFDHDEYGWVANTPIADGSSDLHRRTGESWALEICIVSAFGQSWRIKPAYFGGLVVM